MLLTPPRYRAMLETMNSKAINYHVIPDSDRPAKGVAGRAPSQLSLDLEQGKTLFVPGQNHSFVGRLRNPNSYLSMRGFEVHGRKATRAGVNGLIVWAEKRIQDAK
jgi:hypothetical protein